MYSNTTDPRFQVWWKSARSGPSDQCVEVSLAVDGTGDVAVADSKAGSASPILVFGRESFGAFVTATKMGAIAS